MKTQVDDIIRIREAVLASYKSLSCKMAGKHDYAHGLKEKMTGWGVVSRLRTGPNSRSSRIKTGHGKRGGKK